MVGKTYRDERRHDDLPDALRPLHMSATGRRFLRWYAVLCACCMAGALWLALAA